MTDYSAHVLHYTAPFDDLLPVYDLQDVWVLGDGFGGGMTLSNARKHCYEFSHIRDSSDKAFKAMSEKLSALGHFPLDLDGTRKTIARDLDDSGLEFDDTVKISGEDFNFEITVEQLKKLMAL